MDDEGKSSPIEAELAERVGKLINERYRVLRLIGHGSTGAVYACQHVGLEKLVALKVLHREMEQNASFVDRFKLEAQAASRLEHPNSVRVLDFGQDLGTGALFIAMEYIEGRDLLQVLEEDGPFSAERAVDVMSQILDVLGVAHGLGIVHRDLKPENILLRTVDIDGVTREHVTVCDFGIAQFGGRRSTNADGSTTSASPDGEEGLVAGTPAYMSPEQARAEPQDARSDVYSAGVVLYQLLTLQLPFYADDAYALALKHCVEVPPPPSRFGAVSPQLEEICLKALSKSRDARYQSAREMRLALQRVVMVPEKAASHALTQLESSGKVRRWGRPIAPHGTPSDAPAVDKLPKLSKLPKPIATASQQPGTRGRVWRAVAGVAVAVCLGLMTSTGMFSGHNQEQRASAARPSARSTSMLRPAGSASPRVAAPSVQRSETVIAPISSGPTGAEVPESPQASQSSTAQDSSAALTQDAAHSGAAPALDELVGESGESGESRESKTRQNPVGASKPARARLQPAAADTKPRNGLEKDKDKPAPSVASVEKEKPAAAPAPDVRPTRSEGELELGLLPDVPIELPTAAVAEPVVAANNPPPKPKPSSRAKASDVEPEPQEMSNHGSASPDPAQAVASTASVSITRIMPRSGVSKSSVRGALNLDAITDCYRTAIRGGNVSSDRVVGELDLTTSQSGSVTEASLNAPGLPTPVRHCVEQIVRRGRVREADTGNAQATITLAFLPGTLR
jgi:serine/threonine protein kinase